MRPYNIEELTLLLGRNPKSFKNFNIKIFLRRNVCSIGFLR